MMAIRMMTPLIEQHAVHNAIDDHQTSMASMMTIIKMTISSGDADDEDGVVHDVHHIVIAGDGIDTVNREIK